MAPTPRTLRPEELPAHFQESVKRPGHRRRDLPKEVQDLARDCPLHELIQSNCNIDEERSRREGRMVIVCQDVRRLFRKWVTFSFRSF